MNLNTVISIEMTWDTVQKICNLLAEVGRGDLILPFEEAVKRISERKEDLV